MKTKITPEIEKLLVSLRKLQADSLPAIRCKLKKRGYKYITCGGYKWVYRKDKDPICVKVYQNACGYKEDSYTVPKKLDPYFLHPVFKCTKFLVQEWVDCSSRGRKKIKKRLPDKIKRFGHDVFSNNCGVRKGVEVIIDFCT